MGGINYFSMDFGASTGRGILGHFDGDRLILSEVHRFENFFVDLNGTYYWDVLRMLYEMENTLRMAVKKLGRNTIASIGLDTWGTDYGLVDKRGQMLGNVRCMRNADGYGVRKVFEKIDRKELFNRTGVQVIPGNTIFQLYERLLNRDPALMEAEKILMLPDLLAHFLTGEAFSEYTMATTSMLYNPKLKDWDRDLAGKLGIPQDIFCEIVMPGTKHLPLLDAVQENVGAAGITYVPVGTHDTASAVAAIPLGEDEAFCSSGTWSLFGIETKEAVINSSVYHANFSNEGTVDGDFRLLKNIMGMWIIQQCVQEWEGRGQRLSWDEVVQAAVGAKPFRSLVDPDEAAFYNAGGIIGKITGFCLETGQPIPETIGQIARCAYESLAMKYRMTMEQLESIRGRPLKALRIVGGGCRNRMMNQFAANALKKPVYTGPVEGACIGNILMQARSFGEVAGLTQMREVVTRSFEIDEYTPQDAAGWDAAYEKYIRILKKRVEAVNA